MQHIAIKRFADKILSCGLLAVLLLYALPGCINSAHAAALTEKEIRTNLQKEEAKAKNREESLRRLTTEERRLDSSLAAAEDRILALEQSLVKHRTQLSKLARESSSIQDEYDRILREKRKSEAALRELLRTMWDLHSRRVSIGGRVLEDWPVVDREYYWSVELFQSLESYRKTIEKQQKELATVVGRRDMVGQEIAGQLDLVEKEKASILRDRVQYEQRLATTRKEKENTQAELDATLKLIEDLNFSLRETQAKPVVAPVASQNTPRASGAAPSASSTTGPSPNAKNFEKDKGKLVLPARGRIAVTFRPNGNPPMHGIGFATSSKDEVRSAYAGKVMFSDTMRGLGRVVVVQHGESYFTVYAFLSESVVGLGQNVASGQRIGRTGYYPAIKNDGLYFELRFKQKAINPDGWFAATR